MNNKKIFASSLLALLLISSVLQSDIPYSLDPVLNHEQSVQGFSPCPFWDSMKWQRSDTDPAFFDNLDVKAVELNYIRFCDNFKKSPKQNYQVAPTQFSIPPIIHLIWIGSSVPPKVTNAFNSWEKHHPDWEMKLWTDQELVDFPWSTPHSHLAFEEADTWAEKADILRLEVLYAFGGIYSDADVICLNSFQDLIVQDIDFFSCFELNYNSIHYGDPFFVGSAVLGSAKNSQVIKYCLDHLQTLQEASTVGIIKRTGPGLISRACQAALLKSEENILILPCSYFYPLPWKKREVTSVGVLEYIGSESLAIHLWDGSWCPKKEKKQNP